MSLVIQVNELVVQYIDAFQDATVDRHAWGVRQAYEVFAVLTDEKMVDLYMQLHISIARPSTVS